jgi:hypothetical protein
MFFEKIIKEKDALPVIPLYRERHGLKVAQVVL